MKVLGLHITGDQSSAIVVENGAVKGGCAEERFTRQKRTRDFPNSAISFCLKQVNLSDVRDFNAVAISWNPVRHMEMINMTGFTNWRRYDPEWLYIAPNNLQRFTEQIAQHGSCVFYPDSQKKHGIYYVDHHLAHMACSYYESPFDEAAAIVFDEYGENATITLGHAKGTDLKIIKQIVFPHSLGAFYSMVTEFLGFRKQSDEWKIMGASAYGDDTKYYDKLRGLLTWDAKNLDLTFDLKYFNHYNMKIGTYCTDRFEELIGMKKRDDSDELEQKHYDLSASMQKVFEDVCFEILKSLHEVTGCKNIVMGGGVTMNSLFNGKVIANTPFEKIFIPHAAGDNGCSIGAALWVYYKELGNTREVHADPPTPYLGPSFSDEDVQEALDKFKIKYRKSENVCKDTVALLTQGKIVGWMQGAIEFGERALGNRSILADPRKAENKDLINAAIKYREAFRPFAPSILEERSHDYFEMPDGVQVPYMEQVYVIKKDKQSEIPAVTHADGTGRLQTVSKKLNPRYHELISTFEEETGVPVILNTSFNVQGEPIVCTPADALRTFISSGLDAVVIGTFIVEK